MRFRINFTRNTEPVPNNQTVVNSYVHNCLGRDNKYHDIKSDYAISGLEGGKVEKSVKNFENGGFIIASSNDNEFMNSLLLGVMDPKNEIGFGMKLSGITPIAESFYNGWNNFNCLTPILIKKEKWWYDSSKYKHHSEEKFLTIHETDYQVKVEDYLKHKIKTINPKADLSDFKVVIPEQNKIVLNIHVGKCTRNIATHCKIHIHTNKKIAELLYNIGIGQSTGSGFGTVFYRSNYKLYQ